MHLGWLVYIIQQLDYFLLTYSVQVDAYEAKNQELMAENTDLRALLRSMQVYVPYY